MTPYPMAGLMPWSSLSRPQRLFPSILPGQEAGYGVTLELQESFVDSVEGRQQFDCSGQFQIDELIKGKAPCLGLQLQDPYFMEQEPRLRDPAVPGLRGSFHPPSSSEDLCFWPEPRGTDLQDHRGTLQAMNDRPQHP